MLAFLLGVYYGGNLTLSSFCPNLFCKIPLDKLFHARYTLTMDCNPYQPTEAKMQEPFKATRVYVNNAPTQYHVIFSDIIKQWGQPSICVCLTEEVSIAVAKALNLAATQRGRIMKRDTCA